MNKAILIGRLTRDPDYHDGITPYCKYTLAVDRRDKDRNTDFISCIAFGRAAEFANSYFAKGTKIAVCGRIQTGRYDKDGRTVYTTDIVIDSQEFCESKAASQNSGFDIPDNDPELPFS